MNSRRDLSEEQVKELLRCPMMRDLRASARLADVPRAVLDAVLLWHAQLRVAKLTDVTFLSGEEQLVWAQGWKEEPLGALVWTPQEDGSWWTDLGFVVEAARGQGLYTMLWESCVHKAQEAGVTRIQGGTAVSNLRMQATMAKLGRKPHSIIYDFEVPHAG